MTKNRLMCHSPGELFKPQWAWETPEGFKDETFLMPISFTLPGDGSLVRDLPWQLDDDVQWFLRGIFFPQVGPGYNNAVPGVALCRIRDTHGNYLSKGLVLGFGMWGSAGIDSINPEQSVYGWGFPINSELACDPGTLTFDFQVSTNAGIATAAVSGMAEVLNVYAGIYGTGGNSFTIQLIDPGAPSVPLSVAVVGGVNVQVTLATDGASAITSTFQDVADIINDTPALVGIMSAVLEGVNPAEVIAAAGPTMLADGTDSTPITLQGTLMGIKRRRAC